MRELARLIGLAALATALGGASTATPPDAGAAAAPISTLAKVRAQGYVQCGSAERPGLAIETKVGWRGLEVEICRAVAVAALGPAARIAYHRYDADNDYDSVRGGKDQLSFLTLSEMVDHKVTDKLLPGPPVFMETHDILVAADSPVRSAAELRMATICFISQSAPNASLDAWYQERDIPLIRFAFREDGEMYDAYEVQRCKAIVGEATELARERLHGGPNDLKSRFLPDHLAAFPIVAATPAGGDAQWAAIVAWTIDTLIAASRKETHYAGGGLRIIPIDGAGLGLAPDWQKTVVEQVGTYDDVFRRALGDGSPFKLDAGLNRPASEGGMLVAPFEE